MLNSFGSRVWMGSASFLLAVCTLVGQKPAAKAMPFTMTTVVFVGDAGTSKTGELYTPTTGKPGTWPGIVLVHGSLGLTDLMHTEAGTLAANGYLVLVVDLYEGHRPSGVEDGEKQWARLDRRAALTTCEGAVGFLQNWSMDPENVGAVGWGDGGSLVIDMADEQPVLKAVVDFGGISRLPPERFRPLASRVLVEDLMVPDEAKAIKFLDSHMKRRAGTSR